MSKRIRSRGGLPPDKYLNQEQVKRLRDYIDTQAKLAETRGSKRAIVNKMIIDLGLNSGLRASEICNLQIRDLPVYHHKLIINVRRGKGCIHRNVEISTALAHRIDSFTKKYRKRSRPRSYLFINEKGKRLSYGSLYYRIRTTANNASVSMSPHTMRHSYATHFYARYKDLEMLRLLLGHKSILTTSIYTYVFDETRRAMMEKFEL